MSVFDIDDNLNDKVLFKQYLSDNGFKPIISDTGAAIMGIKQRYWDTSVDIVDFDEFIQKHPEYVKYERFDKEVLGNSGYCAYITITYYPSQRHPEIAKNSQGKYKNILADQIYNLGILYCNIEIYDKYKPENRHSGMKGINDYNDFFHTIDYINIFKQKIFNEYG